MDNSTLIIVLALFTLLAAVAFGLWQKRRATQAQERNEHSSMTEQRPELRSGAGGRNSPAAGSMGQRMEASGNRPERTSNTLEKR